ncbi:MAG: hypothetical protein DRI44_06780 [Chlamydiae bacterium]|nr:MAG: hypothetical protein DRI44_06780 [Chlamydiota bacterium]
MPLISIILPLYNGGKFIEETLLSIGQQSFSDVELIVIDDGSTDNSIEKIQRIKTSVSGPVLKNLKIISKENGGVASARNRGIKEANGKWLAFIDQDDIWLPQKLGMQIEAVKGTNASFCYTAFLRFYADGREVIKQNGSADREKSLRSLFSGKLFIPPSTVLVKKEVAEIEGGFNSDFIPSDEWDFFLTILEKYELVYCPEILAKFRSHPTSTAKKQKRKIFEVQLEVINNHTDIAKGIGVYKELKKRKANVLWHIGNECEAEGDKKSARDYYLKAIKNNPTRIKLIASLGRVLI